MGIVFFDHPQILLLVIVFCCPLIPAGGWCWLRCLEALLSCMSFIVQRLRTLAYAPMYLALVTMLLASAVFTVKDYQSKTDRETSWIYIYAAAFAFSLITILISLLHTFNHVRHGWFVEKQRERVVYIVALPAFYSLMCFLTVQMYIQLDLDTVSRHWPLNATDVEETREFTRAMDSLFFAIAGVFEAFALTFFGRLTMEALRRAQDLKQSRRMESLVSERRWRKCTGGCLMLPIFVFCSILFIVALGKLLSVLFRYFHFQAVVPPALVDFFRRTVPIAALHMLDQGFMVLRVVSLLFVVAILVGIDWKFHRELLAVDFARRARCRPCSNLKFWGVMLFVVLEVVLSVGLIPLTIEDQRKRLIFSAAMSVVCLLVAVLHCVAYPPKGLWIDERPDEEQFSIAADQLTELLNFAPERSPRDSPKEEPAPEPH